MAKAKKSEQELYMEMKMIEAQMEQFQQQINHFDEKVNEATELKKSLEEFSKLKKGDTVLLPLSNGVYAEGTLVDSKKLKVNVGSGVVVGKSVEDTIKLVEKQIIAIRRAREEASEEYGKAVAGAEKLASEIQ